MSEGLQALTSRDGARVRFWRHLLPGPALPRMWVVRVSLNSWEHDVLEPETHTVNAGKGRDPLLQAQCQWLKTAPWFSRALAPVYRSVFSSPDPTHIHPTSVPCPLPCTPATMSYSQSQDEPHCLLRSSLRLENSPSFYLAFARFPQSPWPETLTYPSSLNLDVDFCRNPSLFPRHGCWLR